MNKKLKHLEIILDPYSLTKKEHEFADKLLTASLNKGAGKKNKIPKKLRDPEIYSDPRPLTPKEIKIHEKLISNVIRSSQIIKLLEEINIDLLPPLQRKELKNAFQKVYSKTNYFTKGKSVLLKKGKTKYKQPDSANNIAAKPKVKYGKRKK